jgi:hypothetical protein
VHRRQIELALDNGYASDRLDTSGQLPQAACKPLTGSRAGYGYGDSIIGDSDYVDHVSLAPAQRF